MRTPRAKCVASHEDGGHCVTTSTSTRPGLVEPRRGFILWLTGLSGAGKSTLARAVALRFTGHPAPEILDGDEVRENLTKCLGFSREDRNENVRRIAWVARRLARAGAPVVTAAISPYAAIRDEARRKSEEDGLPFVEVFVSAPLEAVVARDVKGLYKRALAGELPQFTGVSDAYEPPDAAEVVVHTERESVEASVQNIIDFLTSRGLVSTVEKEGEKP
jgi:adenylyl-sulfate kinase